MDITKIASDLGWQPRHDLARRAGEDRAWYLSHPEWVEAIRQQQNYQGWLENNYGKRGKSE